MTNSNRLRLGAACAALAFIAACTPSVESMDCDTIASQAKDAGEGQAIRLSEVRNVREESRSAKEARCVGEATWSDQSVSNVYLRAYSADDGNTMVEYRNMPYEEPARQ